MSVKVLSRVWEHSAHGGTELLLMLAIADFADDDGRAYPAVPTLAAKCRLQQRRANYILSKLKASGELEVSANTGPRGTNRYRIMLPLHPGASLHCAAPLQSMVSTPALHGIKPLHSSADEPSGTVINRQRGRASAPPAPPTKSRRATRLATDWTLPDAYRAFCVEVRPDLNPDAVAESFRDHWIAKAGKDATKTDWLAAWRNWVRRERAGSTAGNATQRRSALHADEVFGVPT